jgi:hypothetical protein
METSKYLNLGTFSEHVKHSMYRLYGYGTEVARLLILFLGAAMVFIAFIGKSIKLLYLYCRTKKYVPHKLTAEEEQNGRALIANISKSVKHKLQDMPTFKKKIDEHLVRIGLLDKIETKESTELVWKDGELKKREAEIYQGCEKPFQFIDEIEQCLSASPSFVYNLSKIHKDKHADVVKYISYSDVPHILFKTLSLTLLVNNLVKVMENIEICDIVLDRLEFEKKGKKLFSEPGFRAQFSELIRSFKVDNRSYALHELNAYREEIHKKSSKSDLKKTARFIKRYIYKCFFTDLWNGNYSNCINAVYLLRGFNGVSVYLGEGKNEELKVIFKNCKAWNDLFHLWNISHFLSVEDYPYFLGMLIAPNVLNYWQHPESFFSKRSTALTICAYYHFQHRYAWEQEHPYCTYMSCIRWKSYILSSDFAKWTREYAGMAYIQSTNAQKLNKCEEKKHQIVEKKKEEEFKGFEDGSIFEPAVTGGTLVI